MLLLMQSYCTDSRKLEDTELVNINPVQTCVVRLGESSDVDVVGVSTALMLSCGKDEVSEPSLLGQYHAFKAAYFGSKSNEEHNEGENKEKLLILVESPDVNKIFNNIFPKLKEMSFNDKDALARKITNRYSRLNLIEGGDCNNPSDEEVKAAYERLLCVISMQFDLDFISLNDEKISDVKCALKKIVETSYEHSPEKKVLYRAKDIAGLLEELNTNNSEPGMSIDNHEELIEKLKSQIAANKEIRDYHLISKLANVSGSIH